MNSDENNSILLLMKTGSQIKSLISFVKSLQRENEKLKQDIKHLEGQQIKIDEANETKLDNTIKQKQELEKEFIAQTTQNEQRINELENEKLYLKSELVAVQHLCQSKEKELQELKQKVESMQIASSKSSSPTPDIHEQLTYIDTKFQKVQKHVYDLKTECDQATSSISQYVQFSSVYKTNTQFLYELLIEAIAWIVKLRNEINKEKDFVDQDTSQKSIPPIEEPTVIPEKEYSITSLEYQFECFEKQKAVFQDIIEKQKKQIEELKALHKNDCKSSSKESPVFSFDEAIRLYKDTMDSRNRLLEEQVQCLKDKDNQSLRNTPTTVLDIHSSLVNTPKSEKRTLNDDHDGNEKKVKVGELDSNKESVSEQAVEHCKKCDEPAYGFMITCCKCNGCFHISCVISKNENVSDLLKKSKKYICAFCQKDCRV